MSAENASRLYLWEPNGHGPEYIAVVAASEAEAKAAFESEYATMPAEDKARFKGWGLAPLNDAGCDPITGKWYGIRECYSLSIHEAGQPVYLPNE